MKPLKAYANVLRYRLNVALRRPVVTNYPLVAYVEPTLFCNLACPACPTGLKLDLRPRATIAFDLFRSLIDEIGDYLFELHMYNWGEPLLHRQTPEMVRYAARKDVRVVLSTNLSLELSDDYLERLVESGLHTLSVSIDGATAETYEHYRRRGDYGLVRRNMLRIQEIKRRLGAELPAVVAQFLVFRHNEHELGRVRAEYREWGADLVRIGPAAMPTGSEREGFEPSTIAEFDFSHPGHPWQEETRRRLTEDRPCSWLYGIFLLNPNGKVSPCCGTAAESDDFADYAPDRGLFAAWNSERFRGARALFADSPAESRAAPADDVVREVTRRFDGLTLASLGTDDLICRRCPIVFMQNTADCKVAELGRAHARALVRRRELRDLVALFLMGMPIGDPDWLRDEFAQGSRRELAAARALGWIARAAQLARRLGFRLLKTSPRARDGPRSLASPLEPERLRR